MSFSSNLLSWKCFWWKREDECDCKKIRFSYWDTQVTSRRLGKKTEKTNAYIHTLSLTHTRITPTYEYTQNEAKNRFSREHGDRAVSIQIFFTEEITSHRTATWEIDNNVLYNATCPSHQHISLSLYLPSTSTSHSLLCDTSWNP